MNGHRYTDATGFRYGTMALDVSGKATSYQLLPGALRFLYVRAPMMAAAPYALAWLVWPRAMYLATLALVLVATWRVDRWIKRRRFRRDVIEPVSAVASAVLQARRVAGRGHAWVHVPANFRDDPDARVKINLPVAWTAEDGSKAALVRAVAAKLQVDELTPAWSLHGGQPFVTLAQPPAPPALASFLDSLADVEGVDEDSVMCGYGPRSKIETFSLVMESPHMLINGGSGAGKSVFLAWLVGQFMRRGYGVLVLDAKFVSHMWLRRVPGVHYAAEDEELHNALIWLDAELLRRARLVSSAADTDAASRALVPLVAVLEEMNSATNRLRAYWKSIKGPEDPAMSPALTALANLANMGREMRVHILMAGQSLTAKSTGGPEGRESFGARALARATANAWRMLAPQIKPAPVKRERPGRWHLVIGDTLRHFQVPFVDLKNEQAPDSVARLIQWATGGRPVPDVSAMILGAEPVVVAPPEAENPRPEGATTLREYATASGRSLGALRMAVQRAGLEAVGQEGQANLYRLEELDHC